MMRFATLKDGCTCDPGCYPEGCETYCPVHGNEVARAAGRGWIHPEVQRRTIFAYDWGYDQTNVQFFEVVRRTKATVWVQEIQAEYTPDAKLAMQGSKVPRPGVPVREAAWTRDGLPEYWTGVPFYQDAPTLRKRLLSTHDGRPMLQFDHGIGTVTKPGKAHRVSSYA